MSEKLSVTFSPTSKVTLELPQKVTADISETEIQHIRDKFSESTLVRIESYAKKIDVTDLDFILSYGNVVQKEIANTSDVILRQIQLKEIGNNSQDIFSQLLDELNGFSTDDINLTSHFSWVVKKSINALFNRYTSTLKNVTRIQSQLEEYRLVLMQDMDILNKIARESNRYIEVIDRYILAGKIKLAELSQSTDARIQKGCETFEKKLYDLIVSKNVALQIIAQIDILLNTDTMIINKIQSVIVNTIPLWKNQMIISLGIAHATDALKFERSINKAATTLLSDNTKDLKKLAKELSKEANHNAVDLDKLQKTNQILLETISDVKTIQQTSRQKRNETETSIRLMEKQLKTQL